MLGMSEGSQQERDKEILENNKIAEEENLALWSNQVSASFGQAAATAPGAEDKMIYSEARAQIERLEELTGVKEERGMALGYGGLGRKREIEDIQKYYKDNDVAIQALKAQGHEVKTLEEITEEVSNKRLEAVERGREVSDAGYRDNWFKALAADIVGGTGGLSTTPEGFALLAIQAGGGEAAWAAKSTIRALGSVAAIEGVVNGYLGGQRTRDEGIILGKPATESEINKARLIEGSIGAVAGAGILGGARGIKSAFTKVNGMIKDSDVPNKMSELINKVNKAKEERGAVPPEVEAARQQAEDIRTVYENKPADMTAEEYTQTMSDTIESLEKTPIEELEIPRAEEVYKTNYETFTPDEITTIKEAEELVEAGIDLRHTSTEGVSEDLGEEFLAHQTHKTEIDDLITCMSGGAE